MECIGHTTCECISIFLITIILQYTHKHKNVRAFCPCTLKKTFLPLLGLDMKSGEKHMLGVNLKNTTIRP
jgi:hypothetical protein